MFVLKQVHGDWHFTSGGMNTLYVNSTHPWGINACRFFLPWEKNSVILNYSYSDWCFICGKDLPYPLVLSLSQVLDQELRYIPVSHLLSNVALIWIFLSCALQKESHSCNCLSFSTLYMQSNGKLTYDLSGVSAGGCWPTGDAATTRRQRRHYHLTTNATGMGWSQILSISCGVPVPLCHGLVLKGR